MNFPCLTRLDIYKCDYYIPPGDSIFQMALSVYYFIFPALNLYNAYGLLRAMITVSIYSTVSYLVHYCCEMYGHYYLLIFDLCGSSLCPKAGHTKLREFIQLGLLFIKSCNGFNVTLYVKYGLTLHKIYTGGMVLVPNGCINKLAGSENLTFAK